ncbi:MAG: DUF3604 domain-containing protein [Rhodobacteraceae bacterium]|nr:DUF3604 domain-containing protein [Paracoccaceae bacterium]
MPFTRQRFITILLGPMALTALGLQFGSALAQEAPKMGDIRYSPYAQKEYPQQVFIGSTHHHTASSGDAFMCGNRLGVADTYRLALGQEVIISTGVPLKMSRPMDLMAITDHAEGQGLMYEVYNGNPAYMLDETLVRWHETMISGTTEEVVKVANEVVVAQSTGNLPAPLTDPETSGAIMKSVWAKENTRESLWDAMYRKESYATSGSRITVRFFGGWDFDAATVDYRYLADQGYAKGVPMGGDLIAQDDLTKAPSFWSPL